MDKSFQSAIFEDIDPLLMVEKGKFNASKYLNHFLLNSKKEENWEYLDLNSSIKKLSQYLDNEIINKRYSVIIKQFYSTFIKLSTLDNSKKDSINIEICKLLGDLNLLINRIEFSNQVYNKNKHLSEVLLKAYNTKFVFFVYNTLSDLICSGFIDDTKDIKVIYTNYEISTTVLAIIKDCNNILDYAPIRYMEKNCNVIKTDCLKRLQLYIIANACTKDIEIWQGIINNSKKDFILSVDRVMVDFIATCKLPLTNYQELVNSLLANNEKVLNFEEFLIKEIKVYENFNSDDGIDNLSATNGIKTISGLAYYKSIKFNESLMNRSLSFIYFGKVAKKLNTTASVQLSSARKSELWKVISTQFTQNTQISSSKEFPAILKQFEVILNPDI